MSKSFDTFQTSHPTCPHCGHELNHDEMHDLPGDLYARAPNEGTATIECPSCDREYWVRGGYQPQYTSAFAEEEL